MHNEKFFGLSAWKKTRFFELANGKNAYKIKPVTIY